MRRHSSMQKKSCCWLIDWRNFQFYLIVKFLVHKEKRKKMIDKSITLSGLISYREQYKVFLYQNIDDANTLSIKKTPQELNLWNINFFKDD